MITISTFKKLLLLCLVIVLKFNSNAQCATNTVNPPYFEGFSGITVNNQLPTCWASSSPSVNCLTISGGNAMAAFYPTPNGTHYFYTKGIALKVGVTYSFNLAYMLDNSGVSTWSNLSVGLSTSQSTTGLVNLASISNFTNTFYASFTNTFTVSSNGIYYLAVYATSTVSSTQHLNWDDLSITIPCGIAANSPNLSASITPSVPCTNQTFTLTASGADTYSWSGLGSGSSITHSVQGNTSVIVNGTSSLSGCTSSLSVPISANVSPSVFSIVSNTGICLGQTATIAAVGASTYVLLDGVQSHSFQILIAVQPSVTTTYTVIGTGTNGCQSTSSTTLSVKNNPTINVSFSAPTICAGQTTTLTLSGADTYSLISAAQNQVITNGSSIQPTATTIYTVEGTATNGCKASNVATVTVDVCTTLLNNDNTNNLLSVFPNPATKKVMVSYSNALKNQIYFSITDIAGKNVMSGVLSNKETELSISTLKPGIYFISILANGEVLEAKRLMVSE